MYRVQLIAAYVLWYAETKGYIVSYLKLMKLLFLIQDSFLHATPGQPAYMEKTEMLDYGPVQREIARKYNAYGGAAIPTKWLRECQKEPVGIRKEDKKRIQEVLDQYLPYSSNALLDFIRENW